MPTTTSMMTFINPFNALPVAELKETLGQWEKSDAKIAQLTLAIKEEAANTLFEHYDKIALLEDITSFKTTRYLDLQAELTTLLSQKTQFISNFRKKIKNVNGVDQIENDEALKAYLIIFLNLNKTLEKTSKKNSVKKLIQAYQKLNEFLAASNQCNVTVSSPFDLRNTTGFFIELLKQFSREGFTNDWIFGELFSRLVKHEDFDFNAFIDTLINTKTIGKYDNLLEHTIIHFPYSMLTLAKKQANSINDDTVKSLGAFQKNSDYVRSSIFTLAILCHANLESLDQTAAIQMAISSIHVITNTLPTKERFDLGLSGAAAFRLFSEKLKHALSSYSKNDISTVLDNLELHREIDQPEYRTLYGELMLFKKVLSASDTTLWAALSKQAKLVPGTARAIMANLALQHPFPEHKKPAAKKSELAPITRHDNAATALQQAASPQVEPANPGIEMRALQG